MDSTSSPLEIKLIPVDRLRPNPWNPNRIPAELMTKLRAAIAEKGMLGTLLVRPSEDHFEVVDGEHRLRIARELNLTEVPCLVIALSDTEAKIKMLQLNGLRGENDPELVARLLSDLIVEHDIEKLASELPYDRLDIKTSLDLLKLLDQAAPGLEIEERMKEETCLEFFSAVVTQEERATIEQALALARSRLGASASGPALAMVCQAFLGKNLS